ncbi:MAG TPA: hypothetical protein DCE41_17960 [Cytophagales bacterium]|nr:hypothetical protein [Cytophagales bacterium]HAA23641.1 hypothetical protein [Cytophagales bacterium]HAP65364.1 hypothetical protein [Cytophagales bacterium]
MFLRKHLPTFLIWYAATTLMILALTFFAMMIMAEESATGAWNYLPDVVTTLFSNPLSIIALSVPYWISRIIRAIVRSYRSQHWRGALRMTTWVLILPLAGLWGGYKGLSQYYNQVDDFGYQWDSSIENNSGKATTQFEADGKQRGIHVFFRYRNATEELDLLVENNVEWITLVPFSYQGDPNTPDFNYRRSEGRISRRDSSFIATAIQANSRGLQVMMKPHIWMNGNTWRNSIEMQTEEDWDTWFTKYSEFILQYAHIAENNHMRMLCVGTELHTCAKSQEARWRKLIAEIREVYSGKLTYAANWYEEFEDVPFWDALDYIGIQGYFPLEHGEDAMVEDLVESWQPYVKRLEKFSKKWSRPILFTEVGYKSTPNAARKPWEWEEFGFSQISFETQANCYEALYRALWDKPWFAGVHWWKWEGENKADFTPKNKPAMNIMAKWFAK